MLGQQGLVERAPVHADAHRLLILHRDFDHGAEIRIAGLADAGVAGIDAVLRQIAGALGILGEQNVAVVVEVADDGHAHALLVELLDNARNGGGSLFVVDGDAHQLRAGSSQGGTLLDGRRDVGGIGVGHGLHHDRCIRADAHATDDGGEGFSAWDDGHGSPILTCAFRLLCERPRRGCAPCHP